MGYDKLIIWGAGDIGIRAWDTLHENMDIVAFGDNDYSKVGLLYRHVEIIGKESIVDKYKDVPVLMALSDYYQTAHSLNKLGIHVVGFFHAKTGRILPWERMEWKKLIGMDKVRLYAGDIYDNYDKHPDDEWICLSLVNWNYRCLKHDILNPYPIPDGIIDSYQSEDVFEHIDEDRIVEILNEIYRVLKPGGYLRLSLPDYNSGLKERCLVDKSNRPVHDPGGGGFYRNGMVQGGGHVWFPTYDMVNKMLSRSKFCKVDFLRYFDESGYQIGKDIDYGKGWISRTK